MGDSRQRGWQTLDSVVSGTSDAPQYFSDPPSFVDASVTKRHSGRHALTGVSALYTFRVTHCWVIYRVTSQTNHSPTKLDSDLYFHLFLFVEDMVVLRKFMNTEIVFVFAVFKSSPVQFLL
jgi:hypothetical protein